MYVCIYVCMHICIHLFFTTCLEDCTLESDGPGIESLISYLLAKLKKYVVLQLSASFSSSIK